MIYHNFGSNRYAITYEIVKLIKIFVAVSFLKFKKKRKIRKTENSWNTKIAFKEVYCNIERRKEKMEREREKEEENNWIKSKKCLLIKFIFQLI